MEPPNVQYIVGWSEHAQNIATNLTQLLYQKHLVDVTLVADGYLFNAHRLVLSAISPNFRKMFTQMPANQQAYVFMKDISRQTMEHLIGYIYTGEVTVKHEQLTNLLAAAKSLDIDGLANDHNSVAFDQNQINQFAALNRPKRISNSHQSKSHMTAAPSTSNGSNQSNEKIIEFRSTQTNQFKKPTNDLDLCEPKLDSTEDVILNEENFDIVEYSLANVLTEGDANASNGNNFDQELLEFLMNNDESLVNELCTGQENDTKSVGRTKPKASEDVDGPKRKRFRRKFDISDYNLVADIRKEPNGTERLYHEHFQYRKNGKSAQNNTQRWACIKKDANVSCRATASTTEIDGIQMMKLLMAKHCHQP